MVYKQGYKWHFWHVGLKKKLIGLYKIKYSLKIMCCHQVVEKCVNCCSSWGLNIRKFMHVKMISSYIEMNIKIMKNALYGKRKDIVQMYKVPLFQIRLYGRCQLFLYYNGCFVVNFFHNWWIDMQRMGVNMDSCKFLWTTK